MRMPVGDAVKDGVHVQVWFQNSRARQKKHQQTTTTTVVSLSSHAHNSSSNNTSSSRPATPSSLMTRHPAAAVAVLSAAAAASYMNLNLRNSLVLHSGGAVGPTAFVADQATALATVTSDAQQHQESVFSIHSHWRTACLSRRPYYGLHFICLEYVSLTPSGKRPRKLKI